VGGGLRLPTDSTWTAQHKAQNDIRFRLKGCCVPWWELLFGEADKYRLSETRMSL